MNVFGRASVPAVAAACGLLAGCGPMEWVSLSDPPAAGFHAQAVPGQVLVKFKPGATPDAIRQTEASFGLRNLDGPESLLPKLGWHLEATGGGRSDLSTLLRDLERDPAVARAEPNYLMELPDEEREGSGSASVRAGRYNDPLAADQWSIRTVDAARAHTITTGSPGTILAIVDTGVDWTHPEFKTSAGKDRVTKGRNWVDGSDRPRDGNGHGTHCAGIAAASANNGKGIVGMAPNVTILAEKVLSDRGSGSFAGVANGLIHSADLGAKVVSLSLGGPASAQVLEDAVKYVQAKDALLVAAMGNDRGRVRNYPAVLPGVMAVGSTTVDDGRSPFSNWGDWISVCAPGSSILSTLPSFSNQMGHINYGTLSGTSMATPLVAGLAALIRDLHPDWDAKMVRKAIEASAMDLGETGFDEDHGYGRVNAFEAVSAGSPGR